MRTLIILQRSIGYKKKIYLLQYITLLRNWTTNSMSKHKIPKILLLMFWKKTVPLWSWILKLCLLRFLNLTIYILLQLSIFPCMENCSGHAKVHFKVIRSENYLSTVVGHSWASGCKHCSSRYENMKLQTCFPNLHFCFDGMHVFGAKHHMKLNDNLHENMNVLHKYANIV